MKSIYSILFAIFITTSARSDETLTYAKHIEPIFREKCTGCHHPGEAAPFSLIDFASVKRRTRTIGRVVDTRYMPPWHAIDGDIPLMDDRRLSAKELDLIDQWIATGAPKGDPATIPEPPKYPEGWRLGKPDLIVKMEKPYKLPAEGSDIYRNFVIRTGLKKKEVY